MPDTGTPANSPDSSSGAHAAPPSGQTDTTPPRKQQGGRTARPASARTTRPTAASTPSETDQLLIEMVDLMDSQASEMRALADKVRAKLGRDTPATAKAVQVEEERNRVIEAGKAGQATPADVTRITELSQQAAAELREELEPRVQRLEHAVYGAPGTDGQPNEGGLQADLANIRAMLEGDANTPGIRPVVNEHVSKIGRLEAAVLDENGNSKVLTTADMRSLLFRDDNSPMFARRDEVVTRSDFAGGVHDTVIMERLQQLRLWVPSMSYNFVLGLAGFVAVFLIAWFLIAVFNPIMGWETAWIPAIGVGFIGFIAGIRNVEREVTVEVRQQDNDIDDDGQPDQGGATVVRQPAPQPAAPATVVATQPAPAGATAQPVARPAPRVPANA